MNIYQNYLQTIRYGDFSERGRLKDLYYNVPLMSIKTELKSCFPHKIQVP